LSSIMSILSIMDTPGLTTPVISLLLRTRKLPDKSFPATS